MIHYGSGGGAMVSFSTCNLMVASSILGGVTSGFRFLLLARKTCACANEHSCSQLSVHPEVAAPLEVLCTSCRAERVKRQKKYFRHPAQIIKTFKILLKKLDLLRFEETAAAMLTA